jgi:hypothetical protein
MEEEEIENFHAISFLMVKIFFRLILARFSFHKHLMFLGLEFYPSLKDLLMGYDQVILASLTPRLFIFPTFIMTVLVLMLISGNKFES